MHVMTKSYENQTISEFSKRDLNLSRIIGFIYDDYDKKINKKEEKLLKSTKQSCCQLSITFLYKNIYDKRLFISSAINFGTTIDLVKLYSFIYSPFYQKDLYESRRLISSITYYIISKILNEGKNTNKTMLNNIFDIKVLLQFLRINELYFIDKQVFCYEMLDINNFLGKYIYYEDDSIDAIFHSTMNESNHKLNYQLKTHRINIKPKVFYMFYIKNRLKYVCCKKNYLPKSLLNMESFINKSSYINSSPYSMEYINMKYRFSVKPESLVKLIQKRRTIKYIYIENILFNSLGLLYKIYNINKDFYSESCFFQFYNGMLYFKPKFLFKLTSVLSSLIYEILKKKEIYKNFIIVFEEVICLNNNDDYDESINTYDFIKKQGIALFVEFELINFYNMTVIECFYKECSCQIFEIYV